MLQELYGVHKDAGIDVLSDSWFFAENVIIDYITGISFGKLPEKPKIVEFLRTHQWKIQNSMSALEIQMHGIIPGAKLSKFVSVKPVECKVMKGANQKSRLPTRDSVIQIDSSSSRLEYH